MWGAEPGVSCPTAGTRLGRDAVSPGHVHCGDIELDPFEPQHHEEALAEGAVSDVFSIQASLPGKQRNEDLTHQLGSPSPDGMPGGGEPPEQVSGGKHMEGFAWHPRITCCREPLPALGARL